MSSDMAWSHIETSTAPYHVFIGDFLLHPLMSSILLNAGWTTLRTLG